MTKRQLSVVMVATLSVVAMVGAVAYKRLRSTPPDAEVSKVEVAQPTPPPAKALAPARPLSEKERLLVGTWKFDNVDPKLFAPEYQATYVFAPDGTFTFSSSNIYSKHWSRRGKFRIALEILVFEPEGEERFVNLIEELTETRLVVSAQDGNDREVHEYSKVRRE